MPRLLHYSDIENVYDDPERAGRLAGLLAARNGDDALVVGSGDDTSPGVLPLVARGRQALDFFEAAGTDVETFGNHDFDYGPDAAREVVEASPQTWVSANVRDERGERFGGDEGVVPWTVERAAGAAVGFFGVTDPATDSLNPAAAELTFDDPYEAAAEAAAALRAEGADVVVALSHLGAGDDELARRIDADAILGGHVHAERVERVAGTLLTRPGVNGEAVLEIELDDGDGDVTPADVERLRPADAPVADRLAAALRSRMAESGLEETVGVVEDPILRREAQTFGGESRIGNLVADAYRWTTDADVGLQNAGGIRTGAPLAGEVTVADLVSILPFEEPVVVVELDGEELLAVFRQLAGVGADFGEPDWWHGHVSGARVVWDEATRELVSATVGGEPVDPDRTYRVATSEYLLHTDHEFPAIEERHRAGETDVQYEVLADYARQRGLDATVEGRIERVGTDDSGAGDDADVGGGIGDGTDTDAGSGISDRTDTDAGDGSDFDPEAGVCDGSDAVGTPAATEEVSFERSEE